MVNKVYVNIHEIGQRLSHICDFFWFYGFRDISMYQQVGKRFVNHQYNINLWIIIIPTYYLWIHHNSYILIVVSDWFHNFRTSGSTSEIPDNSRKLPNFRSTSELPVNFRTSGQLRYNFELPVNLSSTSELPINLSSVSELPINLSSTSELPDRHPRELHRVSRYWSRLTRLSETLHYEYQKVMDSIPSDVSNHQICSIIVVGDQVTFK